MPQSLGCGKRYSSLKRKHDKMIAENELSQHEQPEVSRTLRPLYNKAVSPSGPAADWPASPEYPVSNSATYDESDAEFLSFDPKDDPQSNEEEPLSLLSIQEEELKCIKDAAKSTKSCSVASGDLDALNFDTFFDDENADDEDPDAENQPEEEVGKDLEERLVTDAVHGRVKSQDNLSSIDSDNDLECFFDTQTNVGSMAIDYTFKNANDIPREERAEGTDVSTSFETSTDQPQKRPSNATFDDHDDDLECFLDHRYIEGSAQNVTSQSKARARCVTKPITAKTQPRLSFRQDAITEQANDQLNPNVSTLEDHGEEITEYERQRQKNIAKNQALLRELQLDFWSAGFGAPIGKQKNPRPTPRPDRKKLEPTRRSVRLQERPANLATQEARSHVNSHHLTQKGSPANKVPSGNLHKKGSRLVVLQLTTDDEEDELA